MDEKLSLIHICIDSKAVLAVVEGFMTEVKTSLGKEENVYIRGFGSFIVKKLSLIHI